MRIYYEKYKFSVILLKLLTFVALIATIFFGAIYALQHFRIYLDYLEFQDQIQYLIFVSAIAFLVLLIITKVINKRKNIRFDGKTIKFCINNYEESEFDLRKIDELIKYRSSTKIKYGYQDALAFRFHKNDIWENIDSSFTNKKTKEKSSVLINEINQAYAYIKSQRIIKEISPSQGVRFRYLILDNNKASDDDYDNTLKELEHSFDNYTNTYGGFNLDRLVVTNESLYYNRDMLASLRSGCFVTIRMINPMKKNFLNSEKLLFINRNNELIISIDTTRVINSELFKTLILSVFPYKEIKDEDIIVKENNKIDSIENNSNESLIVDDIQEDNLALIVDKEEVQETIIETENDAIKEDNVELIVDKEEIQENIIKTENNEVSDANSQDKIVSERGPRKRKRRKT